jgi:hypothetical protein
MMMTYLTECEHIRDTAVPQNIQHHVPRDGVEVRSHDRDVMSDNGCDEVAISQRCAREQLHRAARSRCLFHQENGNSAMRRGFLIENPAHD